MCVYDTHLRIRARLNVQIAIRVRKWEGAQEIVFL